jgi:hypothetical protein
VAKVRSETRDEKKKRKEKVWQGVRLKRRSEEKKGGERQLS